jgi:hypothetical protein
MRLAPVLALSTTLLATRALAQVVPGLGADKVTGSAGVEAIALTASLGLPANPAHIAADDRWSIALGSSSGSATGIVEQTASAAARIGRLGLAARATSRLLKNVFEDPSLNGDRDLRVESDEYALGISVQMNRAIRLGALGFATSSHLLSTTADGLGFRVGADISIPWLRLGVAFGDAQAAMNWRTFDGGLVQTEATKRLSIGAATPTIHLLGVRPAAGLEWSTDSGLDNDSWVRGSVSVGVLNGLLQGVAGRAVCAAQPTASYSELGLVGGVDKFQLQFGVRLGAVPVPGNSFTIGIGVHDR